MRRGKIIWYMSYKPMCVRCKENLIVSGPWKEKCTATNEKKQSSGVIVLVDMLVADVENEIQANKWESAHIVLCVIALVNMLVTVENGIQAMVVEVKNAQEEYDERFFRKPCQRQEKTGTRADLEAKLVKRLRIWTEPNLIISENNFKNT